MRAARPLSILVLADDQRGAASTIHDHIQAFPRYSRHRIHVFNPRNLGRSRFLDLSQYDVVVVHYSLVVIWNEYLSPWFREQLAAYDGLKVQFIQDEYRYVDEITATIRAMGIRVLYTVVPPENAHAVYGDRLPDTEIIATLTGYTPEGIAGRPSPPPADRPVDVGYRGRSLPYWLGRLGRDKVAIGSEFLERAQQYGLRCDIAWSESARIYGQRWYEWIASCRAMLASESGSSIVDYDRSVENDVREYLAEHPTASYEEVEAAVLLTHADGPVINTVSPRVFDSAAMRTAMIMFPGEYSGVVRPWEHYIPLQKDFSNMDEVVEHVRDASFLGNLTARTYDDLIASGRYSYRRFVEDFDDAIEQRADEVRRPGRFPRLLLRAEEASTGRSYYVSSLYSAARTGLLSYIGLKQTLRHRALRKLALRSRRHRAQTAGATGLWDDLLRLALLTSVHEGSLVPAEGRFHVVPTLEDGRLLLSSRPANEARPGSIRRAVAEAIERGHVKEIVWNHAAIGQYVPLSLPFVEKRISLDVGRYDSYGVYRFEQLVRVAHEEPNLVVAALAPLLGEAAPSDPKRSDSEAIS
jgi:hypothetical protein